jgi:predicted metal-dependent peptidase
MPQYTAEQFVVRQHTWLMRNPTYAHLSGIFMTGSTEVVDDVPTACTNGRDVLYGREFFVQHTEKEQRAIVLHENWHKALRQLFIWNKLFKENPQLANIAADYVVNLLIFDADPLRKEVSLPGSALLDQRYRNMDTGEVYRLLKQEAQQNQSVTLYTVGDPAGVKVPVNPDGSLPDDTPGMDDHNWEDATALPADKQRKWDEAIDRALRQGGMMAGKVGGGVPRAVTDTLVPKVDWRALLEEFITEICAGHDMSSWKRPNRRWVGRGVYLPSLVGESIGRMVVGIDTSGSIGEELRLFLGAMQDIALKLQPAGVDLLYWDSRVCNHEVYTPDNYHALITSTRPKGGGGTDPQCVVDYLKTKRMEPLCCVMLTDGHVGSWGHPWPCPVIWGITSDKVAKNGKSVKIAQ